MGRYTGVVRSLPSRGSLGAIKSNDFAPIVPFDEAAFKAAGGKFAEGSRISFEVGSRGMARSIKPSSLKNYNALTRRKKVVESPNG